MEPWELSYTARLFLPDECFDTINLQEPALVARIHQNFVEAGADIIETNTFGANHFKLLQHGLEAQVEKINKEAGSIARSVIQGDLKKVLFAGSIGPLGVKLAPLGRVSKADAVNAFTEQISALAGEPVNQSNGAGEDLFIIETISDPIELDLAVQAARSLVPDIHIIGMITFTRDDRTILGDSPEDVGERISLLDLDAIGVNCRGGPVQVLRVLASLKTRSRGMILVAAPKAGCPQQHEGGHVHYPATPSYFAEYARSFSQLGVKIIGGCVGTNESHIAAMQLSLDTQVR